MMLVCNRFRYHASRSPPYPPDRYATRQMLSQSWPNLPNPQAPAQAQQSRILGMPASHPFPSALEPRQAHNPADPLRRGGTILLYANGYSRLEDDSTKALPKS